VEDEGAHAEDEAGCDGGQYGEHGDVCVCLFVEKIVAMEVECLCGFDIDWSSVDERWTLI
jgi:hypothetical protein